MIEISPLWDFCLIQIDSSITSCTPISDTANSGIVTAVGPRVEKIEVGNRVIYGQTCVNKTFIRDGMAVYCLIEEGGIYGLMNETSVKESEQQARCR